MAVSCDEIGAVDARGVAEATIQWYYDNGLTGLRAVRRSSLAKRSPLKRSPTRCTPTWKASGRSRDVQNEFVRGIKKRLTNAPQSCMIFDVAKSDD